MKRFQISVPTPKRSALRILQWELPIILLWSVAILISFLMDFEIDPTGAAYYYSAILEYIPASLFLSLFFAILADLSERERDGA